MRKNVIWLIIGILVLSSILVFSQEQTNPDALWEINLYSKDSVGLGGVRNAQSGYDDSDMMKNVEYEDNSHTIPIINEIMTHAYEISDENIYQIDFIFDRPMKGTPTVVFSYNGIVVEYGEWEDGHTIWEQCFYVDKLDDVKDVTVTISGVTDLYGNALKKTTSKPLFNIIAPETYESLFSLSADGVPLSYDSRSGTDKHHIFNVYYMNDEDDSSTKNVLLNWDIKEAQYKSMILTVFDDKIDMLKRNCYEVNLMNNMLYMFTIEVVLK